MRLLNSKHLLALGLPLITASGFATDRVVPSGYLTIQAAINACAPGDRVLLEPRTFHERFNVSGKNITIKAYNSDLGAVVDGTGLGGSVVTFSGAELPTCILGGLTIQNGSASNGAGINGNFTLATIQNCVIQNNTATGSGGGVYGLSGTMKSCTIQNNTAANGGGVAQVEGTLLSNTIKNNTATSAGGGIYHCSNSIQSNVIDNNDAGTNGGGASDCTTGTMYFNTITNNTAAVRGGGIYDSDLAIAGNIIIGNQVTVVGSLASPGSFGGGISNCDGPIYGNNISQNLSNGQGGGADNCTGDFFNNVVFGNSGRAGGGISNCPGNIWNNTVFGNTGVFNTGGLLNCASPVNCIIYNNVPVAQQITGINPPSYCDVQGWTGGGTGNITASPQVVNGTTGDMHLQASSPCIDSGKFIAQVPIDFEGDDRGTTVAAVTLGDGSGWDIGADEFIPPNVNLVSDWFVVTPKIKGEAEKLKYSITGTLAVGNTGNIPVPANTTVSFYLSSDMTFDSSDTTIGKTLLVKPLAPNVGKTFKLKGKLPKGQSASGLFLLGVVDPFNVISEKNEGDNTAVYGPLP
jgi:hypothetical protein